MQIDTKPAKVWPTTPRVADQKAATEETQRPLKSEKTKKLFRSAKKSSREKRDQGPRQRRATVREQPPP